MADKTKVINIHDGSISYKRLSLNEKNKKIRFLIIGYGHMGKRYGANLDNFNCVWDYYDIYIKGGVKDIVLSKYSHIIISTPPEHHYDCYDKLREFKGKILIDKPIITDESQKMVLDDKRVSASMTERFNPVVSQIKELINKDNLISVEFIRNSNVNAVYWDIPILFDLSIHDLDLYFHIFDENTIPMVTDVFKKGKSLHLSVKSENDFFTKFTWSHECKKRERRIKIFQTDAVYDVDLIDQTILKYEDDNRVTNLGILKDQPMRTCLMNFLTDDRCDSKLGHNFMLQLMKVKEIF